MRRYLIPKDKQMIIARTQDEIVARIGERQKEDFFGFERSMYVNFLDYSHAQPWIQKGTSEKDWKEFRAQINSDPLIGMKDYMGFAFDKANNQRGISANRSIMHYIAWLWLAREDELLAWVINEYENNYVYYGKLILRHICTHFGWDFEQWDNLVLTNG